MRSSNSSIPSAADGRLPALSNPRQRPVPTRVANPAQAIDRLNSSKVLYALPNALTEPVARPVRRAPVQPRHLQALLPGRVHRNAPRRTFKHRIRPGRGVVRRHCLDPTAARKAARVCRCRRAPPAPVRLMRSWITKSAHGLLRLSIRMGAPKHSVASWLLAFRESTVSGSVRLGCVPLRRGSPRKWIVESPGSSSPAACNSARSAPSLHTKLSRRAGNGRSTPSAGEGSSRSSPPDATDPSKDLVGHLGREHSVVVLGKDAGVETPFAEFAVPEPELLDGLLEDRRPCSLDARRGSDVPDAVSGALQFLGHSRKPGEISSVLGTRGPRGKNLFSGFSNPGLKD